MTSLASSVLVTSQSTFIDVPACKICGHVLKKGVVSLYLSSYMNISEKRDEFTASIRHIERFSKSGILIHNCKVPEKSQ